jgi:hypothetical protein
MGVLCFILLLYLFLFLCFLCFLRFFCDFFSKSYYMYVFYYGHSPSEPDPFKFDAVKKYRTSVKNLHDSTAHC